MIISLIHPSRGRSIKAWQTYNTWMKNISHHHGIEHILSIDENDPEKQNYITLFGDKHKIIINDNTSVVEATNHAAKCAIGNILVYLSDDFLCQKHWDSDIVEHIKVDKPCLLRVDDCLQTTRAEVLTIPIMSKTLYDTLGYFWHPEYKSMWVDCDLYHTCKNNNWIVDAFHLKFEHHHYSNGKAVKDETYMRSDANWNQGLQVFNKRKELGFPL